MDTTFPRAATEPAGFCQPRFRASIVDPCHLLSRHSSSCESDCFIFSERMLIVAGTDQKPRSIPIRKLPVLTNPIVTLLTRREDQTTSQCRTRRRSSPPQRSLASTVAFNFFAPAGHTKDKQLWRLRAISLPRNSVPSGSLASRWHSGTTIYNILHCSTFHYGVFWRYNIRCASKRRKVILQLQSPN